MLSSRQAENTESFLEKDKYKQESKGFSIQNELLKNLEPLADYAACYSRPMNGFGGNISYICRST